MGLKSTFAKAAKTAFNAIDDVKITVTYKAVIIGGYSPLYDRTTVTETEYAIDVVKLDPRRHQNETREEPFDVVIMFPQEDLAIVPSLEDTIIINNEVYQIAPKGIESDPADATWTISLLRP